ncbi:type II secretion system F family protein [Fusibacter bizertensis]
MIKSKKFLFKNIEQSKFFFDLAFYTLGFYAFYNSIGLIIISALALIIILSFTSYYLKNLDNYYLDNFIDLLNQINSNLAVGMGFDSAIIASSKELRQDQSYSSQCIHLLNRSIQLGLDSNSLFQQINQMFPIPETMLFSRMMQLSKETGADPSNITDITIDKLYLTHKVKQEIDTILFQKKLEQSILCLAPMFIILFIKSTSSDFMSILYHGIVGRGVMTLSFALIILMKVISAKVVQFEI